MKRLNEKLDIKFLNPFRIIEAVNKQIYRLKFSSIYFRFHNVFYIFLLVFYRNKKDRILVFPEPIPIME
jgi:hypothetical protein